MLIWLKSCHLRSGDGQLTVPAWTSLEEVAFYKGCFRAIGPVCSPWGPHSEGPPTSFSDLHCDF